MNYRIKEICDKRGIKLNSISDKVGISLPALYNIANGKMSPKIDTLQKIAEALNIQIWELFTESTEPGEISGFVKVKNQIYEIKSFDDLKEILKREE